MEQVARAKFRKSPREYSGKSKPVFRSHKNPNAKHHNKEGHAGSSDRMQNKMKYDYLKLLRKERRQANIKSRPKLTTNDADSDQNTEHQSKNKHRKRDQFHKGDSSVKKQHVFSQAQREFKEKKETDENQKKEHDHKMEEQQRALKKYQNKKKRRNMMLNKKTHKGQPIMKYQMNHLLEKIQAQAGHS